MSISLEFHHIVYSISLCDTSQVFLLWGLIKLNVLSQFLAKNHFNSFSNTRYMTPLWRRLFPLSCSTITARCMRVLRCVRVCVCAVEETLKWFVPFGALRHLGEHSLNYARSSVIVPLSPRSLCPPSSPCFPSSCVSSLCAFCNVAWFLLYAC